MATVKKEMDFVVEKQKKLTDEDWIPIKTSEAQNWEDHKDVEGRLVKKEIVTNSLFPDKTPWKYTLMIDEAKKIRRYFYGSKILDDMMGDVELGDYIKVVNLGMVDSKKNPKKQYHNFIVMRPRGFYDIKPDVY